LVSQLPLAGVVDQRSGVSLALAAAKVDGGIDQRDLPASGEGEEGAQGGDALGGVDGEERFQVLRGHGSPVVDAAGIEMVGELE